MPSKDPMERLKSLPGMSHFKLPRDNNKILLVLMVLTAFVLLLPLIFFVGTTLNENKITKTITNKPESFSPNVPYAAHELLVKYKSSYTLPEILNLKSTLDALGVVSQKQVVEGVTGELGNIYVLTFRDDIDVKKAALELSKLSEIQAVGPDYIVKTQSEDFIPNDPGFGRQWDLTKIEISRAWTVSQGSSVIKVAIIDTGIDYNQEDLIGRSIIRGPDKTSCLKYDNLPDGRVTCLVGKSQDNDPNDNDDGGHGTHVAGTVGAVTNNGRGIAGEDPNVTLIAIKAMSGEQGEGYLKDIYSSIRYAADQGAKIINLSLANAASCKDSVGYQDAINYANDKNVLVVAAAGNANIDVAHASPGSCDHVLTVGATDQNDARWVRGSFGSNFGTRVDISAPGVGILSTAPPTTGNPSQNLYSIKEGTSMAAPHVSGVAALVLSKKPNLSPADLKSCLVASADPLATDKAIGPRLNAYNALLNCLNIQVTNPTPTSTPTPSPTLPPDSIHPGGTTVSPGSHNQIIPGQGATTAPVTYSCHEITRHPPSGTIQMGDLECTPNP